MKLLYTIICCLLLSLLTTETKAQSINISKSSEQEVIAGKIFYLHTVKAGETLYSISKAYGVKASIILECNSKENINLAIGETLRIPKEKVNDNRYFIHAIKEGETLYTIYKNTGVNIETILEHNTNIKDINDIAVGTYISIPKDSIKNKKYAQNKIAKNYNIRKSIDSLRNIKPIENIIDIPQKDIAVFKKKKLEIAFTNEQYAIITQDSILNKNINIALFLPFYLDMNDTINKPIVAENELNIEENNGKARIEHKIYSKSKNFIKFYQGFILACDSLKRNGYNITLKTYDTAKNRDTVKALIDTIDFEQFDFIVGPPYASTFDIAAEKALKTRTPIISPLSDKSKITKQNPFVIQLNTSEKTIVQQTANYVYNNYRNSNIVVVYPQNYQLSEEADLVNHLEDSLFSKEEYARHTDIMYTKISYDQYKYFGIKHVLKKGIENIILVPSNDKSDIYSIIPTINALSDNYKISLIALPTWQRFNSLDPSTFYKLNTRMLTCYYIDYNKEEVKHFIGLYRNKYYSEPNNFSFRAYDLANYFIKTAAKGHLIDKLITNKQSEQLQACFNFKEDSKIQGKENKGLHVLHYKKDYTIESVQK